MKQKIFIMQKGLLSLSVTIMIGVLFVLSCNKQDRDATAQKNNDAAALANAKAMIEKNGTPYSIPVNEKLETFLSDENGVRISEEKRKSLAENIITSACNYSNYNAAATLISYTLATVCSSQSPNPSTKIIWHYQVTNNNNIVATNPTNANFKTKGLLRIYTSSNTLAYSEDIISNTTITDLGADANNPGYELFDVEFVSTPTTTTAYFDPANGYVIKLGATMATDCSDIEQFNVGIQPYTTPNYTNGANNPCSRTDQSYFNFNYGSQPSISMVGGYVLYSCTPSTFIYPDVQEVRYSTDGGKTWSEKGMTYHGNPSGLWQNFNNIANKGYVDPLDGGSITMILVHGTTYTLKFQERNIKYNKSYGTTPFPLPTTSNSCMSPWGEMPTNYNNTTFTF